MPEGALYAYAFDQSIDSKRPYFKTPIRGLYLASASTFPGGGIEAVVISGIICANDICNGRSKCHAVRAEIQRVARNELSYWRYKHISISSGTVSKSISISLGTINLLSSSSISSISDI